MSGAGEGRNFYIKTNLDTKIFNEKKFTKMFFPVITKNWNRNFLIKNLVNLKDKLGLKMKNFNIFWVHWEMQFLGQGRDFTKNQYRGRGLPKKGGLSKKEGVMFTNAH